MLNKALAFLGVIVFVFAVISMTILVLNFDYSSILENFHFALTAVGIVLILVSFGVIKRG